MAVASSAEAREQLSADERIDEAIARNRGWLYTCVCGTIVNFTLYGIIMEYATSDGRKLHELSLIFVTGLFYSCVAYLGAALSGEPISTEIKRYHMGVIALFSMGSTFTSVRSLRYVIYPVQVLAKSCKPVPVMVMGKLLYNKQYSYRRYAIILTMVSGVALFVIGGKVGRALFLGDVGDWEGREKCSGMLSTLCALPCSFLPEHGG
eukprot:scaffold7624_cov248-Pinguiococcus_pyrenoidosus.AAC.3